ncbi:MAG: hypothetical protein JW874_08230 [Spirochaetales bacterium]|nr:hypothetical protein [Spirochaetales bacterium]
MRKINMLLFLAVFVGGLFAQLPAGSAFGYVHFPADTRNMTWYSDISFSDGNSYALAVELDAGDVQFTLPGGKVGEEGGFFTYKESGKYTIETIDKVPFFRTDSSLLLNGCVVLFDPRKIIFIKEGTIVFVSAYAGNAAESLPAVTEAGESSYLKEGKKVYNSGNLDINSGDLACLPWVESAEGCGIGEQATISWLGYIPIRGFLISNGFVSAEKPDLYLKNSRVRKVRIDNGRGDAREFLLDDRPGLQCIELYPGRTAPADSGEEIAETYTFTILDVYKGSKWQDTCLNLIIPLTELNEGIR